MCIPVLLSNNRCLSTHADAMKDYVRCRCSWSVFRTAKLFEGIAVDLEAKLHTMPLAQHRDELSSRPTAKRWLFAQVKAASLIAFYLCVDRIQIQSREEVSSRHLHRAERPC